MRVLNWERPHTGRQYYYDSLEEMRAFYRNAARNKKQIRQDGEAFEKKNLENAGLGTQGLKLKDETKKTQKNSHYKPDACLWT